MKKRRMIQGILICFLFLLSAIAVQFFLPVNVSASLTHRNMKENVITVGDITSEIEEEFHPPDVIEPSTTYEKIVSVRNLSDTPCYVRIFIEKDQENLPVSIQFDNEHWTEKQKDGYYYYRTVLGGKEKTRPVIAKVTTGEENTSFRILVYEETVQAEGHRTAQEAFASIRGEQESGV